VLYRTPFRFIMHRSYKLKKMVCFLFKDWHRRLVFHGVKFATCHSATESSSSSQRTENRRCCDMLYIVARSSACLSSSSSSSTNFMATQVSNKTQDCRLSVCLSVVCRLSSVCLVCNVRAPYSGY